MQVQVLFLREESNTITISLRPSLAITNRTELTLEVVEPTLESPGATVTEGAGEGEGEGVWQEGDEPVMQLEPAVTKSLSQNEVCCFSN